MGSFSYTCGVSKLPIEAGDKIRYILLTENPYGDDCGANGHWFPRSFPIRAEYNDYGSVENVEDGIGRDLWMEALKIDLLSVGVGDNSVHDVPTSKNMKWEQLLEAIVEKRVFVRQDVGDTRADRKKLEQHLADGRKTVPNGVPTMQRVCSALKKAKHAVTSAGFTHAGFLVDKIRYGTIRVRWSGNSKSYGKDVEKLEKAQKALSEYATVVKAGSGSYAHIAELMVYAKPNTAGFHDGKRLPKKRLTVSHIMVREDVWQKLLGIRTEDFYNHRRYLGIEDHRKAIRDLYDLSCKEYHKTCFKVDKNASPEMVSMMECAKRLRSFALENIDNHSPVGFIAKDGIPFAVGLGTNWRLLIEKNLPEVEAAPVLDSIAEMVHVMKVLLPVRWSWVPSTSCGPQFGEWEKHAVVNDIFSQIATDIGFQHKVRQEEFEKECQGN